MGRDTGDLWRRPMKELVGPETEESNDTEEGRRAAIVDPIQRIPEPGMKNQIRVFNPHILNRGSDNQQIIMKNTKL